MWKRLGYLSSRILVRLLTQDEQRIARKAYDDFERYYSAHPEDARKFLDDGEHKADPDLPAATHAALSMLASQLFNLERGAEPMMQPRIDPTQFAVAG